MMVFVTKKIVPILVFVSQANKSLFSFPILSVRWIMKLQQGTTILPIFKCPSSFASLIQTYFCILLSKFKVFLLTKLYVFKPILNFLKSKLQNAWHMINTVDGRFYGVFMVRKTLPRLPHSYKIIEKKLILWIGNILLYFFKENLE